LGLRATIFVNSSVLEGEGVLWPDALGVLGRHIPRAELMEECRRLLEASQSEQRQPLPPCGVTTREFVEHFTSRPASEVLTLVECLWERFRARIPEEAWPRYLNAEQVRILRHKGFEIGGHTLHHPILTRASPEMVRREIAEDRQRIEALLGERIVSFAYPNGAFNREIQRAVTEAGYECAVTVGAGSQFGKALDLYALERLFVSEAMGRDRRGRFSEALFFAEVVGLLPALRRPSQTPRLIRFMNNSKPSCIA